jgi:hypothetical protein
MSRPPSSRPLASGGPSPAPPTGAPSASSTAAPKAPGQSVNTAVVTLDPTHGRILCVADVRGKLSTLNDLAREHGAHAILHTGDFGFFGTRLSDTRDLTLTGAFVVQQSRRLSTASPTAHSAI